ncbi:putative autophagy-related protein 11 [Maniola hyperantus]|uniref:putative autophagy-related protein 11 n=1 Tax=Aphantopus hyperantus TaxID=2795564 RepID=UPI0037479D4F
MVIKLTVNSEWKEWKDKFLETFKNQGWDMVTTALAFRYKEGLLIDYAIKKERLILDINKSIDPKTMTDLIATGLPGFILNRLNRDELNNTTDLFNEIRKYEGMIYKKNSTIRKSGTFFYKNKTNEKKPCKTCESLDKGIKYHPEESCWFKKNKNESEKLFKANNSIIEVDMNTEKKKRVSTPLIKIKLLLENKLEVSGIYDSGSQISLINSRLIKVKEKKDNVNIAYMKTVNGVKKTDGLITIKIKILDLEEEVDVYIIENEDFDDFIVGLDMIKKFKLTQNEDLRIEQKKTTNKIDMMSKDNTNEDKNIKAYAINFNEHIETQEFVSMTDHLDNEKKIEIEKIIKEYKTIFAKDKYDIGSVKDYEARIDLLVNRYCSKRPYRCTIEDKLEIEEQISMLLKNNLIEESYSPFAAPVTLAFKKDASLEGIGAILKQTQLDGKDKPVAYFSKKLNESQKRKKAIYLECLAMKEAVKYWQHWLIGKQFTIYSDHKPLENMNIKSRTDEELGDLTYYLSQYDFTVKYIPGKENVEADCLSPNPVLESEDNKEELLKIVNLIQIKDIVEDQEKNETIKEKRNLIHKNRIYYKKIKKHEKIILSEEFSFAPKYLLDGTNVSILPNELKITEREDKWMADRKLALENTIKSHMYNKKVFDRNRKIQEFNIGDSVYVENGNRLNRKKLDELKIGPFKIIEKISNSMYRIDTGNRKTESTLFHITKLQPVTTEAEEEVAENEYEDNL